VQKGSGSARWHAGELWSGKELWITPKTWALIDSESELASEMDASDTGC